MDNPFSATKIIQNNMFPQVEVEKEEAATWALLAFSYMSN